MVLHLASFFTCIFLGFLVISTELRRTTSIHWRTSHHTFPVQPEDFQTSLLIHITPYQHTSHYPLWCVGGVPMNSYSATVGVSNTTSYGAKPFTMLVPTISSYALLIHEFHCSIDNMLVNHVEPSLTLSLSAMIFSSLT
jgi:hypothetical protein